MRTSRKGSIWLIVVILSSLTAARPASAQTYQVLHYFNSSPVNPRAPLVQANDGNFYGTTADAQTGTSVGSIFRVTPEGALTTLYRFTGPDGASPNGLVQASDGNLYGTTFAGGVNNKGTVFRLSLGGTLTTLYFFSGDDGSGPRSALVQGSDGNLYGTTSYGGLNFNSIGTGFRLALSGSLTKLHEFSGPDGWMPNGLIQASDGYFYGTAAAGGTSNVGTVFRMTSDGAVTTLYSFTSSQQLFGGVNPSDLVQGSDGDLYGTTTLGGGNDRGMIYKVTSAGVETTLYSFSSGNPGNSNGVVMGGDGAFYGTCASGGDHGVGAIFRMSPPGIPTTIYSFSGADGASPGSRLIVGADGNLYGTTTSGGAASGGTVFRVSPPGTVTSLASFANLDGFTPQAGLLLASDGNFYGTTFQGGSSGRGTVFAMTPAGTFATLHSFLGSDGAGPFGLLVEGSADTLFGTTRDGGAAELGTTFSVTTGGVLSSLHSLSNGDGSHPVAGLAKGTDGNYYGTAYDGGIGGGTVFQLTPGGVVTTIHSFSGSDGSNPSTSLVTGTDGDFYGTTSGGGTGHDGTAFRITPGGALTTLHAFSATDSGAPNGLTLGQDGNFYGTTTGQYQLYPQTACQIFRMTPSGVLTTLYSFPLGLANGCPTGPLLQGASGDFFGTTTYGGAGSQGSVFELTPTGSITTLYSFMGSDGSGPGAPLVQGTDGDLYGVTRSGGPSNNGVIFRLSPSGPPTPQAVVSGGAMICLGSSTNIQAALTGTPPWNLTWSDGLTQTGITASPANRTVSPQAATLYSLPTISDANGSGYSSGSATVLVTQPLSAVRIVPAIPVVLCIGAGSADLGVVPTGGGTTSYQWGYRTIPEGSVTPIPGAVDTSLRVQSASFPGPGAYLVVVTATPTCGSPVVTNELPVTVAPPVAAPVIVAPAWVASGATNMTASVPAHEGSYYYWSIEGGYIAAGWGTSQITFAVWSAGIVTLSVSEETAARCIGPTGTATIPIATPTSFYTVTPCRQLDTRTGSTPIAAQSTVTVPLISTPCSIPPTARSVSVNVIVTQQIAPGDLTIYAADESKPGTTTMSFSATRTRANNAILLLSSDGTGSVTVSNSSFGPVHLIIDVNGYFE